MSHGIFDNIELDLCRCGHGFLYGFSSNLVKSRSYFFSSVRCCINGTSSKTLVCVLGYGLFQAQVVTVFHVLFHTQ